jgi:hypothetical protein
VEHPCFNSSIETLPTVICNRAERYPLYRPADFAGGAMLRKALDESRGAAG